MRQTKRIKKQTKTMYKNFLLGMNELDSSLAYLVAMTTACGEHNHEDESLSGDALWSINA